MSIKRVYILIFIITGLALSGCISIRLRTANENYQQYAYAEAIKDFEWVLQKKKIPEAIPMLADCYRQTGNSVKAEYWYKKANKLPDADAHWKLFLAEALMKNEKYDEARTNFIDYLALNRNDLKAQRLLLACDSLKSFYRDTTLYSIQMLRFNVQAENNFSPTFYNSGIVFLSDRNFKGLSKSKSDWTGKRYLDLFYAARTEKGNWIDPEPLRGDLNGRFNEGPAVFTSDFNTMYFTRNNYTSNKVEKNKKNINVLKIYQAVKEEGFWKLQDKLVFNTDDYTVCHPAINSTGTVIYFASDIPWGYGGMDIYQVHLEVGNNWSKPENLGPKVNAEGNELFPSMQNDSTLYFSSDGHIGMGGLDVFVSHFENGEWQKPVNLNAPINSSHDDFGFIIDSGNTTGFFSSNRYGGLDKIFSFKRNQPKLMATLSMTSLDQRPSSSVTAITIYKDGVKDTTVTNQGLGNIGFKLAINHNYEFNIDNKEFYAAKVVVSTIGRNLSEDIPLEVKLDRVILNKQMIWQGINFKKKDNEKG